MKISINNRNKTKKSRHSKLFFPILSFNHHVIHISHLNKNITSNTKLCHVYCIGGCILFDILEL